MRRRAVLSLLAASGWLAACGGGGGGGDDALPTSGTGPPPVPGTDGEVPVPGTGGEAPGGPLRRDVAVWGDSLTVRVAELMAPLLAGRQVYNGGVVGETSAEIAQRHGRGAGQARADWINIFWYGHNNQTESDRIVDDIAQSIARLASGNERFLVMSLVNQAAPREARGGQDYETILRTNRILQERWPRQYLDVRGFLVRQADRNRWDDERDFLRDVPPASLRYDAIHLNDEGSGRVARLLRDELAARAW
jgi:hypothetical protein